MKSLIGILVLLSIPLVRAKVPYAALEKLRLQTLVVRTVLDSPNAKESKACRISADRYAELGANLALITDNAKAQWASEVVQDADIAQLRTKIENCNVRASCAAYSEFLSSAKVQNQKTQEAVELLQKNLENQLSKMNSQSYHKAWVQIAQPCGVLKGILQSK